MVDPWTNRTPTSTEFPRTDTDGIKQLVTKLQRLGSDVRESTSNLLRNIGIYLTDAGMRIESSLTVEGDLSSTGEATFGGTLTTTGEANIGGAMNVTGNAVFSGDLAVPNGSITNAALSNPVTSAIAAPGTASGWAASTAYATKASTTIAVPSGYSQALVFATGSVTFQDTAANRFDTRVGIAGGYGAGLPNLANTVGCSSEAHSRTLPGLSGGTITLEVQCLAAAAAAAQASNTATVTGFAIFFR